MELKQKTGWAASLCIAVSVVTAIILTPGTLDGADAFNLNRVPQTITVPDRQNTPGGSAMQTEVPAAATDVDVDAALYQSEPREAEERSQGSTLLIDPPPVTGQP